MRRTTLIVVAAAAVLLSWRIAAAACRSPGTPLGVSVSTPAIISATLGSYSGQSIESLVNGISILNASLQDGSTQPMTAAHRTSGVAPLGVFFDAVNVTPATPGTQEYYASPYSWNTGITQPSDMEGSLWVWDFGDPSSGTWSTTGNSKNSATGYTAAHVYEAAGTYTVNLTVIDTAGSIGHYSQSITVSDPDIVFSTTTKYVAANGNDSSGGTQGAPYLTIGRAMTDIDSGIAKRVLLRRGDTFNVGTSTWSITADGPGLIGAYGAGNRPIITCSATGFTNIIRFTNSGSTWPTLSGSDWRVMDLDFNMTAGTSQASSVGPDNGGRTAGNITILRVLARNFSVAFLWQTWDLWAYEHSNYGIFLVDSEGGPNVGEGSYACYGGGYHSAWLGNNLHDNANSGGTHILRIWQAHKSVISNNRLWNPGNNRHALKLHSPSYSGDSSGPNGTRAHEPCTRWVTVTDNKMQGTIPCNTSMPAEWIVSVGPQDSINEEWTSHIVYERNRHYGGGCVDSDFESSASYLMVKNNVFDSSNSNTGYDYHGIQFARRGIEPQPTNMRFVNNTFYLNSYHPITKVGQIGTSTGPYVTVQNTLFVTPSNTGFSVTDPWETGAGYACPCVVPATSDHNLWSVAAGSTIFTDPSTGNLTLNATSPALDAGATLNSVRQDFVRIDRTGRGSGYDIGAYER